MNSDNGNFLVEYSLFDIRRIVRGLMSPKDSGEHKLAVMAVTRLFGPVSVSILLSLAILGALLTFIKTQLIEKGPEFKYISRVDPNLMKPADRKAVEDEIDREVTRNNDIPQPPQDYIPAANNHGVVFQGPEPLPPDANLLPTGNPDPIRLKGPILSTLYQNRVNADMRRRAESAYGAPKELDDSVLASLRWLKKKQDPDGSWKTASDVDPLAMTGLAALTFLAHGETPQQSKEFGPTLEKAIRYLIGAQKEDGRFSANSYTHAIVTYALAEAFALTRIMEIREPMQKGVAFIIDGQQEDGGFDYGYAKKSRFDTSVAGWNIQALKAAYSAGHRHPGLTAAIERSVRFLKTQAFAQNGSGFVYSGIPGQPTDGGGRWAMTGVGTLGLQILGHAKDPETRQGMACLENLACDWPDGKEAKPNVYGWYYVTQAKFQGGGTAWKTWNRQFSQSYLDRQVLEPDGCGYWPQGDQGGAVYTTTLATLTLEVYYRYLPTYKTVEEVVTAFGEDDVKVEVL